MVFLVLHYALIAYNELPAIELLSKENGTIIFMIAILLTVVKILWKRDNDKSKELVDMLTAHKNSTQTELEKTREQLKECEKSRLDYIQKSLQDALAFDERLDRLEKEAKHDRA